MCAQGERLMFSRLNNRMILALLLIIILLGLNIKKFYHFKEVVPVWSSYDQSYYDEDEEMGFLDKTKSFFAPDNILYRLTRIRVRAPITYLKREIPLLAYYTPEALREPVKTIYQPAEENRVIKLKFDLREEVRKEEIEERPEPEVVKKIMDYQPLVFIYHTHTSETYVDDPRIQDNNAHVLPGNIGYVARVGAELADLLSGKYNFRVVHTTNVHDVSYARSYLNSRQNRRR